MYFLSNTQIYKNTIDINIKIAFKTLKLLTFSLGFQQKTPIKRQAFINKQTKLQSKLKLSHLTLLFQYPLLREQRWLFHLDLDFLAILVSICAQFVQR